VADLVRREFGVRYHVDHVGRLLRAFGWRPVRPARRMRQCTSEKVVQRRMTAAWRRVKKKRDA
jgi:transposase